MNIWHTGPKKCLSLPNQLITIITKKKNSIIVDIIIEPKNILDA